jgi:hypothetical protein
MTTRSTLLAKDGKPFLKAVILDFAPRCESDPVRRRVLSQSFPTEDIHYVIHWPITDGTSGDELNDVTRLKLTDIFSNGIYYDRILVIVRQGANDTVTDLLVDEVDRISGGDVISVAHVFEDMILSPCIGEGMRWSPDMDEIPFSMLA